MTPLRVECHPSLMRVVSANGIAVAHRRVDGANTH
jgi:hypothetical protein